MSDQNKNPMLHLICGLPGTGKTLLAKSISASTGSIRFSPDEWIKEIWADKAESEGNRYREKIEQLQWKMAKQLLQKSTSVIIEWGAWGRNEREKLRDEARALGAKVKFYYLEASREILRKRILNRNQNKEPYEFYIQENEIETLLDEWISSMQIPTEEELGTYDFIG